MVSIGFVRWLAECVALSRVKHLKAKTGAHAARSSLHCSCKGDNIQMFQINISNQNGRWGMGDKRPWSHSSWSKYFQTVESINHKSHDSVLSLKKKCTEWIWKYCWFSNIQNMNRLSISMHTNNNRDTQRRCALCNYKVHSCTMWHFWGRYILQKFENMYRCIYAFTWLMKLYVICVSCRIWKSWNTYSASDEYLERSQTDQFHCKGKG